MDALPAFPWDTLAAARALAAEHPGGIVDLSVGSPVDATPDIVQDALRAAADAPFYPMCWGTPELRQAIAGWFARTRGVAGLADENVMPTVGSKELVAGLPLWLGLGPGDVVVHPSVAYPTYDIGARIAGATPLPADDPDDWPVGTKLVWVNSPSNPTGAVAPAAALARIVERARAIGAVVASDECYALLPWEVEKVPSILDAEVAGASFDGLLAVYSLSKQSNLAGYRAAFVAGDARIVKQVLEIRKHAGLMPPTPVQHAMTVALGDDAHVDEQRERYRERRQMLRPALERAGFDVASEAGLYLWSSDGTSAAEQITRLARLGILAAPGSFYGDDTHVRLALTATDERVAAAAERLSVHASTA